VIADIQRARADARQNGSIQRPRWPMIVLRTPKGWTCPKEILQSFRRSSQTAAFDAQLC